MTEPPPVAMVTPEGLEFLIPFTDWSRFDRQLETTREQLDEFHRLLELAEARHAAWRAEHPEI